MDSDKHRSVRASAFEAGPLLSAKTVNSASQLPAICSRQPGGFKQPAAALTTVKLLLVMYAKVMSLTAVF